MSDFDSKSAALTEYQARWQEDGTAQATPFTANSETPLLLAAEFSGLELASSCRNGTCRTCICKLLSGRVTYRIEWPGLSAEEKAEGYILPCVAYPASDVVLTK